MARFSIECPKCGSINQASTGLFAKKKIICGTCGEEFEVKASRMTSRVCPQCGNIIVYDQARIKGKKCPICGHELSLQTPSVKYKMAIVNCPQCSCAVEIDTTKEIEYCPICECKIDVKKELEKKKQIADESASVIRYEGGNDILVWKHPVEDFNIGSVLIVHESQNALFLLNGEVLNIFGAGSYVLDSESIPFLSKLFHLDNQLCFHAEVYFINLAAIVGLKWGTDSRVKFIEPYTGLPLDIGLCGEMNLKVSEPRKLVLSLVGTSHGLTFDGDNGSFAKSIKETFYAPLMSFVKSCVSSFIKEQRINILEIDEYAVQIADMIKARISPEFDSYGLSVAQFYITAFSLPENDYNFQRYKEQISKAYLDVKEEEIQAEIVKAEQKRKIIEMQTQAQLDIIKAQGLAEATKLTGIAEADVMKAKGYSQKDVMDAEVQKTLAEGVGKIGPNGGIASDMLQFASGMKVIDLMSKKFEDVSSSASKNSEDDKESWDCSCGKKGLTSLFCPDCGNHRPDKGWDCVCGEKNLTSNFCPKCGRKKQDS